MVECELVILLFVNRGRFVNRFSKDILIKFVIIIIIIEDFIFVS